MRNDYQSPDFKKLLQKLQEESWQLELLISGFAIFGLFTAFPNIAESAREAQNSQQIYKFVVSLVAQISCAILIFNLLLHVLLRGLWIGALGLRYVSGDIDYEVLNYSEKFTKYLKKKVGSFDKYIATLENYCSIMFAVSFLLVFYVLAVTFTILIMVIISNYILDNDNLPTWISKGFGIPLILFVVLGMFMSFIDFVTQGFFKKKKWLSKIYFPIYWVFSFITLSFLYRPLVYNFLDNKFGKRLSFILVPIYFLILLSTSFSYKYSNYINDNISSSSIMANSRNYEDMLHDSKDFIDDVAIQSKVITNSYVKVFIVFSDKIEDRIFDFNESLKPEKDVRGLGSDIRFGNLDFSNKDSLRTEYLKTFNTIFSVDIDSVNHKPKFSLAKSLKEELGFETYLSTKNLTKGKHFLKIKRLEKIDGGTSAVTISTIPFWYFKD